MCRSQAKSVEIVKTALKDPLTVAKLHFMFSVGKQLQQFVLHAVNFLAWKIIIITVLEKSLNMSFQLLYEPEFCAVFCDTDNTVN